VSCPSCASLNESEFTAEIMIHASGMNNPGVPACPKIAICMDCGSSRFIATPAQLRSLGDGIA
jgi:hypothetical protein